jgi:hypothetical protein
MGNRVNARGMDVLGWTSTAAVFVADAGLIATWLT